MKVLLDRYSTYYHPATRTQFEPRLDKVHGRFVAVADVDDGDEAALAAFRASGAFKVVDAVELELLLEGEPKPGPATGDPLADAALVANKEGQDAPRDVLSDAPPAPPAKK